MAIYNSNNAQGNAPIYDAATSWKENCLIHNQSLLWKNDPVWTMDNLKRLEIIFVGNPDETGSTFEEKLKKQLEQESENVYKLFIEILFIYYLFPHSRSIRYETKVSKLKDIAEWKGILLDKDLPILKSLQKGLGSTGTYYNTNKFDEISYLILIALKLKEKSVADRERIVSDHQELKEFAEQVRTIIGKRVTMQHVLLHLIMPERFERIASWGHKDRITKAFTYLTKNSGITDTDEKLLFIREHFEEKYGDTEVDFYDTKEIAMQWESQKKTPLPNPMPGASDTNDDSLTSHADDFGDNLVFQNADVLFQQVKTAIDNGKHIILTGPPGTGKSKLAHAICNIYNKKPLTVTASSNWSTYETIGGYHPDRHGNLMFEEGLFLKCFKEKETNQPLNTWLIIDEINRADIDKAFGSLFSVLAGDEIALPFEDVDGKTIILKPQSVANDKPNDYTYVVSDDWRIIGTMNTVDKSSLYEMSYAFMRRFAFIPVGIPKEITTSLMEDYLKSWNMTEYPNVEILKEIWTLINNYRKIGPAIVQDIAKHTLENEDFTSSIILYVLPQFEGLPIQRIREFAQKLSSQTQASIEIEQLDDFITDFFEDGLF
ncbi:AAA family ATPase [Sporosarcina sp. OR05]|uniref:AAA family ATPase n=1 Tax=Sporosarcina sp. OR05 TaxID=2969819 RepID=UPI00352A9151